MVEDHMGGDENTSGREQGVGHQNLTRFVSRYRSFETFFIAHKERSSSLTQLARDASTDKKRPPRVAKYTP